MRFVFVSAMSGSPWGGSEELWSQTAVRLHEIGHEVMASVVYWPVLSSRITALVDKGIKLQIRGFRQSSVFGRAWDNARRRLGWKSDEFSWIQGQMPDLVVISQGGVADGLECLKFCNEKGLPCVVISQCNAEAWWPTDRVSTMMSEEFSAARKLFFVSRMNLALFERQIGNSVSNATIVRNPFNVSPDKPIEWPAETGTWRLACVARLDPIAKGHDLLFQVLAQPCWREREVELNLYGTGPYEHGLRRLAKHLQLSRVRFNGHVDDVAAIWKLNHLLVLPSRFEGLPLALVEAMWCGRPAVVTDVAGNGELSIDGETGFVAAAPTAGLLAFAMETAWEQRMEWRRMGVAARARVEQVVPKDPVGAFCRQLIDSVSTPAAVQAGLNEHN